MTASTITCIVLLIFVFVLLFALFKCVLRIKTLVDQQDELAVTVEECLDVLDKAYRAISTAAGEDVMSDDIVVRRVVSSIFAARKSVHVVAAKLSSYAESEDDSSDK